MQTTSATGSTGFTTMSFTIEEITPDGFALGVDNFNRPKKIPSTLLPSKGPVPKPGETWLISKTIAGLWAFVGIINNPAPPVITGAHDDGTALANLLSYLDAMGYIVDQTTPTSRSARDYLPADDSISAT